MRFRRKVWRHIPSGSFPFDYRYILRARGRWNREGTYGCLYTSLSKAGARAEYKKYLNDAGVAAAGMTRSRDLVSLKVTVDPVMDLTDPTVSPVLVNSPFLVGDDPADREMCRILADSLRAQGYAGIIAPSAAKSRQKNLVIYFHGPARNLDIDDGGDRESL